MQIMLGMATLMMSSLNALIYDFAILALLTVRKV